MTDMDKSPSNWYPRGGLDRSELRSWYDLPVPGEPAGDAAAAKAAEEAAERAAARRKRRRTRILALCACAILMIGGAAAAAHKAVTRMRAVLEAENRQRPASEEMAPTETPQTFDDYRDYFADYYSGTDEVEIPRAEAASGVTLTLSPAEEQELSLQEIYEQVSPAVVGVTAWRHGEKYSWGTGVVFTEDGYLVTNTHVISGCERATVAFADGREREALLVGEDSVSDIAVLKLEDGTYPYAAFGDSRALRVGDLAAAIGNPLGEEYAGTMTDGIISAIDRSVSNNGHSMSLLQTNAALNEGNSGGPLVNAYGQVVGITNMKIMSVFYSSVEGIGFAIPSEAVKQVADQLLAEGAVRGTPAIGITAAPVTTEAMVLYDLPMGVYVASVSEASDAAAKGMVVGDIILAVNGTPVATVSEVNAIKDGLAVGDTLTMTVYRDGEAFEMEIALIDQADMR